MRASSFVVERSGLQDTSCRFAGESSGIGLKSPHHLKGGSLMRQERSFWVAFLLLLPIAVYAAPIFKCVDEAGRVTFTQNQNCPRQSNLEGVSDHRNVAPSGSGPAVKMADPSIRQPPSNRQGQAYTVVGEQPAAAPVVVPTPDPQVVVRPAPNSQPCTKVVNQMVNSTFVGKDGKRVGRSEIRKVVVPC